MTLLLTLLLACTLSPAPEPISAVDTGEAALTDTGEAAARYVERSTR